MKNKVTIQEAIQRLAGKAPTVLVTGVVVKVDNNKADVAVEELGLTVEDIPLRADVAESGSVVLFKPKVDSEVTLGYFKGYGWIILSVSLTDLIWLGGDTHGGLVIAKEVEDNLKKLKDYEAALKNATLAAITTFEAAFTGLSIPTGASATFNTAMAAQQVVFGNMENEKVKHGS